MALNALSSARPVAVNPVVAQAAATQSSLPVAKDSFQAGTSTSAAGGVQIPAPVMLNPESAVRAVAKKNLPALLETAGFGLGGVQRYGHMTLTPTDQAGVYTISGHVSENDLWGGSSKCDYTATVDLNAGTVSNVKVSNQVGSD